LEAVQKLRDPSAVQVYLFGTTIEQEYEQQLRDLARDISVQFHGAYRPADLQAFDLDIAVFASITSESYSFALDEALRLGLPVLVSDRGALPERTGKAGLTFRAGNADDLARRLQEILDKPELLDMMRRNIRPDTLFSMEAHVAMLEKIYGDATSANKPKQDSTTLYLQLLAHAMRQVGEREQQMQALGQEVERLHAQMAEAAQEMAEAAQEVERLHAQMADIQSSLAWWLAVRIQQVKSRLFPLNTRRGKLCEGTLQNVKAWLTITPALDARAVCNGAAAGAMTCTRPLAHLVRSLRHLKTQWNRVLEPRLMRMLHRGRQSVGKSSSYYIPSAWTPLSFPSSLNPKVSIVIPAFNAHLYTYACLRSIVNAVGCTSYEVIVVDGSSQDETPRMLETMQGIRVIRDERNEGASVAYNAAATVARGEYLLFLNNDIVVLNGWLEAMLDAYATHDNVGAVGAKLIYPDGRLQEAGGILWQDGSVWKYGCFDDPDKPEYNYVREVDYCSGACVMIQRNLFEQLEGFAGHYSPAYYEVIDLCLRVRTAGFKVMYQPAAVVVHCEGVSSGKDAAQVSEPHRVLGQLQFHSRWAHRLRAHAANGMSPHTEKERNVKKRVLIVDDHVLRPDQDSGSLRMWNLIQLWQSLSFKVTFAAANLERVEPYVQRLQGQGAEVLYAPFISSLEDHLREFGPLYDVVLLSRPDVGTALLGTVRATCPRALVIYDSPDLYFLREMRQAQVSRNFRLGMLARIRKQQEFRLFQQTDIALVVSPVEQRLVTKELPAAHVEVISNIHDIYGSAKPFCRRTDLLFVGGFAHVPNVDAVQYFVREIFPLLRPELPDVKFYIVGSNPPPEVVALAGEDVIVTGYKEDIAPYFANCRVFLAPLRYGAGVKGKINMSMSHGLPVVATPLAVEGMRLVNEWDVLIGETDHEFSSSVVRVYKDEELWNRLSSNGIENARRFYSREVARATLERIVGEDNLSAVPTCVAIEEQ
jgi:GT2 family glycosyltransferase/glycosyltransferase involved in cell wall biosynthesis